MKFSHLILLLFVFSTVCLAQDKAEYEEKFIWDSEQTILSADFSKIKKPQLSDFKPDIFHFDPVRQDTTGTCWAYSTVSFLESEIYRQQGKKIKLSEMQIAYWEYVEKARRFIQQKGDSEFEEGSQSNSAIERIRTYGCLPIEAYSGLINGQTKHNHEPMHVEMFKYLTFLKTNDYWDEDVALKNIRQILNKYIGEPPVEFDYQGKNYTPASFRDKVCKINPDDYVDFMSTLKHPFYTKAEFEVPDNWWHSKDYHNIPLDVFYKTVKSAIRNGYSMVIGGDVSEPGKYGWEDIAIVVPWDLSQKSINQYSREMRIYNETTTDDHGIHLLGYTRKAGHDWYLIKDSGSSSHYGQHKGYYFFRDDFIKLKMLGFLIHKDAVKELLKKFD